MQFLSKFARKTLTYNYYSSVQKHSRYVRLHWTSDPAPMAAGYQPKQVEATKWQQQPQVALQTCERGTFRMLLPPPNVTGNLHLGHALMATVQDVICRYQRQMGYKVDWVPGTDHAGIATQVVVEKKLWQERGVTRHQIGRAAFLEEVWKWKQEKGPGIVDDLKKLGCTLNWEKEYFTMDEHQALAVNTAFVKLFEDGLIRRRQSLVNWSCALESTISDIEVDTLEITGPTQIYVPGYEKHITFGHLYDIRYRICDSDDEIVVSTTRPETMLGDVAVAVHPQDKRYTKYLNINVSLWHPFRKEKIPLIPDDSVARDFGTGAVKITPAHDKTDFEIANRHSMAPIQVFTERGTIVQDFDQFKGMPRFEARYSILDALKEQQLLGNIKDHAMSLPICSRSKDVIEQMLRPQWFLHCQPMANEAVEEVRSGRLQIEPPDYITDWCQWLNDCRDWCISRQLWWGHQIPAYFATTSDGKECWVAALNEEEAMEKACNQLNSDFVFINRDEDVLDTWFSAALLPFSAFGWPKQTRENYTLDIMETGHDILFFWVARMVMLGLHLTKQLPFKTVLLNGIVCDAHGRKMSKSLGNVVSPQQVIQGATLESLNANINEAFKTGLLNAEELKKSMVGLQKMFPNGIQECGTDALRFTLCSHNIKSHFISFNIAECHTNKLFLNKIWQATRFTLGAAERLGFRMNELESINNVPLSKWDHWILSRLGATLLVCVEGLDSYNLHAATAALKQFFYSNFCDVYLETTKSDINAANSYAYMHCATLATCLSWGLQAMSPFTPFIAEELLQYFPQNIEMNLSKLVSPTIEAEIAEVLEICQCIRQLKSINKISKKHEPQVHLLAHTEEAAKMLVEHLDEIKALTLVSHVELDLNESQAKGKKDFDLYSTAGHLCAFGLTTNASYKESQHVMEDPVQLNAKKLHKLEQELMRYRDRVENPGFRKAASEEVQKKHLEKIRQLETEINHIKWLAS